MLTSGPKFRDLGEVENPEQNLVKWSFGHVGQTGQQKETVQLIRNETKMGIWKSRSGLVVGKQGVIHESSISHKENGGSLQ